MRKRIIVVFILAVLIPFAGAQQPYNQTALEHFKQSLEYLMVGDYHNAIISSNNVLRIDPFSSVSYVVRARAYFELNDFDRVVADCTQAIRHDRNNAAAFVIRGNVHIRRGDITRAISDWQAALRINPNIPEAEQNIALARQQQAH
ncbi:MAG: hypothetical protein FWC01_00570 [Treponema sp.]|nr:hypothetical protein [Treponema sp.]MCL2236636.1 hypothetical protein [Treponema sp.]